MVETDNCILLVETKAANELDSQEVQAKAEAAARWAKHASDHALSVQAKPWRYLIIPHNEMSESKRLSDFLRFELKSAVAIC